MATDNLFHFVDDPQQQLPHFPYCQPVSVKYKIGQGGQGSAYYANSWDEIHNERVHLAIKAFRRSRRHSRNDRFPPREIVAYSRLKNDCPYIPTVWKPLDVSIGITTLSLPRNDKKDIDTASWILPMELCQSDVLDKLDGGMNEEQCRNCIREVLLALEHAHTNGVAHGDVKPENVCIGFDGHVRLADWNSCTLRHKLKAVVPVTKQPCGTWKYSPPENCWQHDVNGVGNATMEWDANASDMWNVGVLTYTCFTGCELFSTGCLSDPFLAHYIKATEQVEDADELIDSIVSHNVAPNNGKDAFLQQQNKGIDRMKTHAPFRWPPKMRPIMRDFIRSLLCVKPTQRSRVEEAIQHPWIQGLVSDDIPNEIPTPDIFDFDGMNDNNINHVSSSHEFALYRHIDEDEDPI